MKADLRFNRMVLVFGLVLMASLPVRAANIVWTNVAGGSFNTGANWSGGVVPGGADIAKFISNATYTVTFPASTNTSEANFYASSGTTTLDIGNGNVYYADIVRMLSNGSPRVDLISGMLKTKTIYMGEGTAHTGGTLRVYNPGAALAVTNTDVLVGNYGSSYTLVVSNGGSVYASRIIHAALYAPGSNNLIWVTGSNSLLTANGQGNGDAIDIGTSGHHNRLVIEDGAMGVASNGTIYVGKNAGADYNSIFLGAGSILTNVGGNTTIFIGYDGSYNSVTVSNASLLGGYNMVVGQNGSSNRLDVVAGGVVRTKTHVYIGNTATSVSNTVVVSGSGSLVDTAGYDLNVGNAGHYNYMLVTNGATVSSFRDIFVGTVTGSYNRFVINGSNSVLALAGVPNSGNGLVIGRYGSNNVLRLENGARLIGTNSANAGLVVGSGVGSSGNSAVMSTGSVVNIAGSTTVGSGGDRNSLTLENSQYSGAQTTLGSVGSSNSMLIQAGTIFQSSNDFYIASSTTSSNNLLTVTGPGTQVSLTQFDLRVGDKGNYNTAVISNGAAVLITRNLYVGRTSNAMYNVVHVMDGAKLSVGQSWILGADPGNIVSNYGGTYQFLLATPTITLNGNPMAINGGTIAFRNVSSFDVKGNWSGTALTNLSWSGNNTLRFDNTTNSTTGQSYTFGTGLGSTNYTRLELVNGSLYRGGNVTIGAGGSFLASNGTARINGSLTNLNALTLTDCSLTVTGACYLATGSQITMSSNSVPTGVTVGGTLTLPGSATFTFNGSLARDASMTLFSAGAISGTPANWTSTPLTHRLKVVGNTLVLTPRAPGFVMAVQ